TFTRFGPTRPTKVRDFSYGDSAPGRLERSESARRFTIRGHNAMTESIQKKLGRVRPLRVQITYDFETGGAIEMKELPFVMGIMADLSGNPEQPLPMLKDPKRKFVEIDRDNFDSVMKGMAP